MRRILQLCREIVRLVQPYLVSEDRLAAWLLLLAILALTLASAGLGLLISFSQSLFFTALQEKHADAFILALFWFTPHPGRLPVPPFILFVTANIAANCLSIYLQAVLQLRWQRWLTGRISEAWLLHRSYYRLPHLAESSNSTDNPDQRIQEDIEDATRNVIGFAAGLLTSIASVVSFGGLLYALSGPFSILGIPIGGYLLWTALLYAAGCTLIAHLAGSSIAQINFIRQRYRGDFRVALVRVREHAEEIAFLRGERAEQAAIAASFSSYYRTALDLVLRTSGLTFLSNMSSELAIVFPTVIAAPRFFAGQISFGTLTQIRLGFLQLAEAALWFVATYADLAEFVSQLQRISTLQASLAHLAAAPGAVEYSTGANVTLEVTNVSDLSGEILLARAGIDIPQGRSTAITGPSGIGKTTLLRLLSGLWTNADGRVVMPGKGVVYVPQRAYLPAGTLRAALCYPNDPKTFSNTDLVRCLCVVGIGELATSLDIAGDWSRRLSPGQSQRLALARAILARPNWLFLDEPTSSLHPQARLELQRALVAALPSATLVTVTHDTEVAAMHDRRIDFASHITAREPGTFNPA